MSFSGDIRRFKDKTVDAADKIYRGTALDIFAAVVKRTPVKTGRARGNWNVALNSVDGSTSDDRTPRQALAKGSRKAGRAKMTDTIYITNNLPYAPVLERGSSKQAPNGMVAVTITEFKRIVDSRARNERI